MKGFSLLCIKKYKGLCVGRQCRFVTYYPKIHKVRVINAQGKEFVYHADNFRLYSKYKRKNI